MKKKTNILFICKYNRFRSRVAASYLKKINKRLKIKSAGLIKGRPLDKNQINSAKKLDIKIKGKPNGLSTKILKQADLIIIVADDVPKSIFINNNYVKKLLIWKIPDAKSNNKKEVKGLIKSIIKQVDKLNKQLQNSK